VHALGQLTCPPMADLRAQLGWQPASRRAAALPRARASVRPMRREYGQLGFARVRRRARAGLPPAVPDDLLRFVVDFRLRSSTNALYDQRSRVKVRPSRGL